MGFGGAGIASGLAGTGARFGLNVGGRAVAFVGGGVAVVGAIPIGVTTGTVAAVGVAAVGGVAVMNGAVTLGSLYSSVTKGKDAPGGGVGPEDPLVRQGTSPESAQRLGRQAEAAENGGNAQNGEPYGHGVSVTTPASNNKFSNNPADAVSATRNALEQAGFPVRYTPTRRDPFHHTVQLPKPVTQQVADLFNSIFGRKSKGG